MGLREKVALAMVAVITAQIICSHCMPRGLPNCSVKSPINSLISAKSDSVREFKINKKLKRNSYNNVITGNSSNVLNLPNIGDFGERDNNCFLSGFTKNINKFSKKLPQTRSFKREAIQKRYLDTVPRDKTKVPLTSSSAPGPPLQPYCFRKSDFFPEVEYPLSARDMWIPKYWSRLMDAETPRNVKIDVPIYQNHPKNTKPDYSNYENSSLNDIIKKLNSPNNIDRIEPKNFEDSISKKNRNESIHEVMSSNVNINTTVTTELLEYTTPKALDVPSEVSPYTSITTETYPVLETTKASSVAALVTSAITTGTVKKTPLTPSYAITSMIPITPTTISPVTSSDLRNSEYHVNGITTTLPFEYFTSPITQSITSADNFISHPNKEDIQSKFSNKFASLQPEKQETYLSETNAAPTTTASPLLTFISSTEKTIEQKFSDHTVPMSSTTMSSVKSSETINSDLNLIDVTTASPLIFFTSPMTSEALDNNSISDTQMKKIPTTLPTTVTSTKNHEGELYLMETNNLPTTTSPLLSFSSTVENKPEQELRDYTTSMRFTPTSKLFSDDKLSITDVIFFSNNGSDLLPSSNLPPNKAHSVNYTSISSKLLQDNASDLDTNESLLKNEVMKKDVDLKTPSIPSSTTIEILSDHSSQSKDISLPADKNYPENPIQMDHFQHRVTEDYSESVSKKSYNSNTSINFIDCCKENWVFSPNDSYITWESDHEYPDECFIFIDADNKSSLKAISNDDSINLHTKTEQSLLTVTNHSGGDAGNVTLIFDSSMPEETAKKNLDDILKSNLTDTVNTEFESVQSPQEAKIVNNPVDNRVRVTKNNGNNTEFASMLDNANSTLASFVTFLNDSCCIIYDIGNTTIYENVDESQTIAKYLLQKSNIGGNPFSAGNNTVKDIILYVEGMNSTSENVVYVDEEQTWASYTEIPYESVVLYPEEVNDTWSAIGNDYVIYQQMLPERSDDTLLLFDTENAAGLLNDVILNTN